MSEYAVFQKNTLDTAERVRFGLSGLLPDIGSQQSRSGLFDGGGVVTLTSGMSVSVSKFRGYVQGVSGTNQGGYFVALDAPKVLTFADGSGSNRTDLVVARVYDNTYDGLGTTDMVVEVYAGTPGGGTPATPANAIKLAEKVITPSMSAGSGGLGTAPTDRRPPALVTRGGIVPVVNEADRTTLAAYPGLTVYRIDQKKFQFFNGVDWDSVPKIQADLAFVSAASLAVGSTVTVNVTFPKVFAVAPIVTAICAGFVSGSAGAYVRTVDNITTSGCRIVVGNLGSAAATWTDLPLQYIAVTNFGP